MPLQVLSLGGEVDVWRPRTGRVHSAFGHAVNLLVDDELWTLLEATRMDAPFGIRLAAGHAGFDLKVAHPVHVRAGYVGIKHLILDCRSASRWAPTRWARPVSGLAARLVVVEDAARLRAWGESASMAEAVTDALRGSDAQLGTVLRRVVGRGPGLTPAGDDVLMGILALLTSGATGSAGVLATSRLVTALAVLFPTTTDVSRHLLHQAARGLPGRTLHELGQALMDGAVHEVLVNAIQRVLDSGCTSGADACMGLTAACRFIFSNTERAAA